MHLFQFGRNVRDEQLVGARLGNHAAPAGQYPGSVGARTASRNLRGNFTGLGIVDLERLGANRFQALNCHAGFQFLLVLGCQFVLGGDQQHIACLAHAQPFGLQDDVERLVPRHVFQPQGDRSGNGVRGDHIEVGEIGNHLQQ